MHRASPATYSGRVRFLALGFFLVFVAYSSAQLLQTALNGTRGYACLFAVYAAFGLCSLYAPALVARFGPVALLPGSACGYAIMVAANLFRGASAEALLAPSCVFVGACAATLWSAQAVYLGQVALALSVSEKRELTLCTSELNAEFYSSFMSSGVVSGLFASAVMMSGVPDAVTLLFLLLTGVGVAGVAAFALLPEANDPSARVIALPGTKHASAASLLAADAHAAAAAAAAAKWWEDDVEAAAEVSAAAEAAPPLAASAAGTTAEAAKPGEANAAQLLRAPTSAAADAPPAVVRPTLFYMLRFLATDRRMRFIIPTIFCTGFGAGYVNGAWMGSVVARRIGVQYVGLVGATYAAVSSLAAKLVWAPLAQRRSFGRRWSFAAALAAYVLWYLAMAIFLSSTDGAGSTLEFSFLFAGSAWHGFFDPVLSSFVPATLQTFFSGGRDGLCAMSSVRVVYSAGFSMAQLLSVGLGNTRTAEQAGFMIALTLFAAASLVFLHLRVCSIDLQTEQGEAGTEKEAPLSAVAANEAPANAAPAADVAHASAAPADAARGGSAG